MRSSVLLVCVGGLAIVPVVSARTWYITPDGSGDAPTIQAGIDSAAAADTVLVACGTYYEHDIRLEFASDFVLSSETGEADCVVIDAQWNGTVLLCIQCDATTLIKGFTLTHGTPSMAVPPGFGGAMVCASSSPEIVNCAFIDNRAGYGAGVSCEGSAPTFTNCLFSDNNGGGGAGLFCNFGPATLVSCTFTRNASELEGTVYCNMSSPRLINCTFYGNSAELGGSGIYCASASSPVVENTIIAYSGLGEGVLCEDGTNLPILTCCDIYGNTGGDWVGCIADQYGVNGNFSADPKFCDTLTGDFRVEDCSPCMPGYHPDGYDCGGVIGAYGSGCACGAAAEPSTWGSIKAIFR
jgi:hypothetical protein